MAKEDVINEALSDIFTAIERLKLSFPDKKFTIDGRLVGDIGETIASLYYDIELFKKQKPDHDGLCSNGKVQVKATFKDSLTFRTIPEYYLGIKLFPNGGYEEIYNGPGQLIYDHYKYRKSIGNKLLSFPIAELNKLSKTISPEDRIKKRPL